MPPPDQDIPSYSSSAPSSSSSDHPEPTRPSSSSTPLPPSDPQLNDENDTFSSSKLFSSLYNNNNNHSSSSSSNPQSNPLLPGIPINTASILASKYDPSLSYFQSSSSSSSDQPSQAPKEIPRIPEKCFSFCTQSDGDRPLCRMFCLRKRPPIPSQKDQLKRLRPSTSHRHPRSDDSPIPEKSHDTDDGIPWYKRPFESLRKTVTPYSFIYIKGTPDGVIGRYMEELEWDDGEYDFGNLSRSVINGSAVVKGKRRSGEGEGEEGKSGWTWLDWGEHGSLLHLPFTTLFHPLLSIPTTLSSLLTPSYNLIMLYEKSFTDGGQARSVEKFSAEIKRGGAMDMLNKLSEYWERKVIETKERREEMMKQLKEERSRSRSGEVEGGKNE
ncbi:hypothetical protein I302_102848 [Kwoniella bestiolae CBS 10118]|uniref:Uncharacterized protein n=1 Tax=Kwoniella bestiolae CBS 10118 TaxID=1296100 RepID=A0A1B9GGE6_9TREE|nr:hypothetical protein I302_01543 [Kwoniella bestiolae CBS 10118]OCF30025.1 hypothetical protein I302_01543 [Kwoniella bestiolae CBS 10118]